MNEIKVIISPPSDPENNSAFTPTNRLFLRFGILAVFVGVPMIVTGIISRYHDNDMLFPLSIITMMGMGILGGTAAITITPDYIDKGLNFLARIRNSHLKNPMAGNDQ